MTFKQLFLAVATMLVGGASLADIWAGFIAACISSILVLRIFHGSNFMLKVKLIDVFIWLLGVFVSMRCWSLMQEYITKSTPFSDENFNDSVMIGFATGVINTYLYVKNYDPIKKRLEKYLK